MPSVLFWSGQPGGTAEYRALAPSRALERLGWDVRVDDEGVNVTLDGRVQGDPDVLVLVRAMGDYVPDMVRRVVAHGRTTVVYDSDDWFRDIPGYNPASQLPVHLVESMHQAMREAHLITCSTPELAEGYRDLNRTVVLPNFLDPDIWGNALSYRTPRPFLTVGWAGAFHWRTGDLDQLRSWVPRFLDQNPDIRFAAIGCRELLEWLGIDGVTTPELPPPPGYPQGRLSRYLHPYEHLPALLGNLDVGLVPLIHSRFNQAKSWCKGMEYNAAGVPFVASSSREYRSYLHPGVNGLFARPGVWEKQVRSILDDLDAYRLRSRAHAERYFIDNHIHRWVDAYTSARVAA